jgi:phosphohistidine phosphatase
MLTLIVVRHAKSDQSFFGVDFERPLNERGKRDAPVMAKRLKEKISKIDAFVSSAAIRAKQTAETFITEYGRPATDILFERSLYHAPPSTYFDVVSDHIAGENIIAVFGHNPGISYFIQELLPTADLDEMPTCAVYAIQIETNSWQELRSAKKSLLFFDYPKM